MDETYSRQYRRLFDEHWWWRVRERFVLEILRQRNPTNGFGTLLDVGCGDGLLLGKLAEFGVPEGVEPADDTMSSKGLADSRIHRCFFDCQFQPGKRYGAILMLDVLEHIEDDRVALEHAADLLEPDGLIMITVPAFAALWTSHDDLNHHHRRYTVHSFRRLARDAGIRIELERYFFYWTCVAKLFVRFREFVLPRRPDAPGFPPRWANRFFELLCAIEQRLAKSVRVPFGSSLMIVGRKMSTSARGN